MSHRSLLPLAPLALLLLACAPAAPPAMSEPSVSATLRVATYNTSLNDDRPGGLIARLERDDPAARRIAAVIQRLRPDLLLVNEFDYDPEHRAADLFQRRYLEVGQFGEAAIAYPYRFLAPVNTGVASGHDLDRDGRDDGPGDAWGFGRHPGQYGMLVLSRHPLDEHAIRTFRTFKWKDLPGALAPHDPDTGLPWYDEDAWRDFPLSSKSHWDVPVDTPLGRLHFLVAHPTPPVFDGPENRNGLRNHDEIRLWTEYLSGAPLDWLYDDAGRIGGLPGDARFVIAGDLNADPVDGDGLRDAILTLLQHPRMARHPAPRGEGREQTHEQASEQASERNGGGQLRRRGDPGHATADFGPRVGTLRVDYVLPSNHFAVPASGVFWPRPDQPGGDWIEASDHRPVWIDLADPTSPPPPRPEP